jgi:hypothetical protein
MKFRRRQFLHLAGAAAALPVLPRLAFALDYPTRSVRVIVAFAPGGVTDTFARLMAQKLGEHLGKRFYVENIAGATGNIGTGQADAEKPDLVHPPLRSCTTRVIKTAIASGPHMRHVAVPTFRSPALRPRVPGSPTMSPLPACSRHIRPRAICPAHDGRSRTPTTA